MCLTILCSQRVMQSTCKPQTSADEDDKPWFSTVSTPWNLRFKVVRVFRGKLPSEADGRTPIKFDTPSGKKTLLQLEGYLGERFAACHSSIHSVFHSTSTLGRYTHVRWNSIIRLVASASGALDSFTSAQMGTMTTNAHE